MESTIPATHELPKKVDHKTDPDILRAYVREGVKHVMTMRPNAEDQESKYIKYMDLYSAVFNYCSLSRMPRSLVAENNLIDRQTGVNALGADVYDYLIQYFTSYLEAPAEKLKTVADEELLACYAGEWNLFSTGANYVDHACAYLNRQWLKREKKEGRKDVYQVYLLALMLWRDRVFYPIQSKLVTTLLKVIENERNGETIDTGLVRKVIDSFVALSLNEKVEDKPQLDLYEREFQIPFIEATERYYTLESAAFFQSRSSTVQEYIKKVEERLREEEDRVEHYLHPSTRTKLIGKCEDVLIRVHLGELRENLQILVDADKDEEDLQRMRRILSRISNELDPLSKELEEDVITADPAAI
ncbi:Cullin repeat-like-containing domain protein [Rhizoctonia solani]|nr:Cullin repeat-like-containing domain protein [Rhizoctonia solani]